MLAYSDKLSNFGHTNMHAQTGYLASSQANAFRMLYPQLAYANYQGNLAALALATQGQYSYEYAQSLASQVNFAVDSGLSSRKSMNLSPNSSISDGKDDRYNKVDCGKFDFSYFVVLICNIFLFKMLYCWILV